jgi:hypothetical protein
MNRRERREQRSKGSRWKTVDGRDTDFTDGHEWLKTEFEPRMTRMDTDFEADEQEATEGTEE